MITEVQITCTVLMSLMTFILAHSLPRIKKAGSVCTRSRQLLAVGTTLIAIHFLIQFYIQEHHIVTPEMRTSINLLFGIPSCYLFNYSLLYLLRNGRILKWEWAIVPLVYLPCIPLLIVAQTHLIADESFPHISNVIVSLLYALTLLFSNGLQLQVILRMRRHLYSKESVRLKPLIKWSQWSILIMVLAGLGLPIMTFCENLAYRSFYGILSITTVFFYLFSFISYYINHVPALDTDRFPTLTPADRNDRATKLSEIKIKTIDERIAQLIAEKFHHKPGISIQDTADMLNISRNMLNEYFQTTPYGKFNNWLKHLRLEDAKTMLLEHPDWTNETVAQECGFGNRAYFQSQFCEYVGISPSKWIKMNTHTEDKAQTEMGKKEEG